MTTADVQSVPTSRPTPRRLVALVVFAPTLGVLLLAASLKPNGAGEGTHTQLGLPSCGLKARTGVPCPSCGMTTAFAHAAHGQLWQALVAQPAGAVFALVTAMAALVSGYVLITGAAIEKYLQRLWRPAILWLVIGLFVAGWVYRLIVDFGDYT